MKGVTSVVSLLFCCFNGVLGLECDCTESWGGCIMEETG